MTDPLVLDEEYLIQIKLKLSGLILKFADRCPTQTNQDILRALGGLPDPLRSHLSGDVRGFLNARNIIFDPKKTGEERKSVEQAILKIDSAKDACTGFDGNKDLIEILGNAQEEAKYRIRVLTEFLPGGKLQKGQPPDHAARQVALFAAHVYVSWTGEEIHSRTVSFHQHDDDEKLPPGDGFPTFVAELFVVLEIDLDWRSPTECAKRDWDQKVVDLTEFGFGKTE